LHALPAPYAPYALPALPAPPAPYALNVLFAPLLVATAQQILPIAQNILPVATKQILILIHASRFHLYALPVSSRRRFPSQAAATRSPARRHAAPLRLAARKGRAVWTKCAAAGMASIRFVCTWGTSVLFFRNPQPIGPAHARWHSAIHGAT